jgi:hypothetical protein
LKSQREIVDAIALMLDRIAYAQTTAQNLPGNNWPLRRALLECADRAIEAKRRALTAVTQGDRSVV